MENTLTTLDYLNTLIPVYIALPLALIIGLPLGILTYKLHQTSIKKRAQAEAQEIIQDAKDEAELKLLEEKERIQEIETELWAKDEKMMLQSEERIEELDELAAEKKQKLDNQYSQARQKTVAYEKEVEEGEGQVKKQESELQKLRNQIKELNDQFVSTLAERLKTDRKTIKDEITTQLEQEAHRRALQTATNIEEQTKEHSEQMAKDILDVVIHRFARSACPERGIASVYFENENQRKIFIDAKGENVKVLAELTGCDIIVEDGMELIGVAGFDPVRRELTRRVLEKLINEKRPVTPEHVKRTVENYKRDLLGQIKRDGDQMAKELRLEGLHPEIRQMMGSLRYRYSFTQNQYFHCGEVGWLCGLLASELRGVDLKKARRSGMLHDLGKAMDHELDGGHAVIGADFISQRGEAADVVHAVKAHHYDESPTTDLAFLVIAADAISGARPGARRSTIESYNQKVTELESIARSFDGVTDCYILSGGRECRVLVNGKRVDDVKALQLSKEIAARIEAECSYPGQIKVVVVRETLVYEATKAHA